MILCRKLREGPSQWKFEAQTDTGTETVRFTIQNARDQPVGPFLNYSYHKELLQSF